MPQRKRPRHEELVEEGPLDAARVRRGVPLPLAFGLPCHMCALACSGVQLQKEKDILKAGQWRSAAFMKYMDEAGIDKVSL